MHECLKKNKSTVADLVKMMQMQMICFQLLIVINVFYAIAMFLLLNHRISMIINM